MALLILAELTRERSCPTSSHLCTLSHHGLAQGASSDDLGNGRVGLTPLPVPVDSASPPSWDSAHRAGGMLQTGMRHELVCKSAGEWMWGAAGAPVPCPASSSTAASGSSYHLLRL